MTSRSLWQHDDVTTDAPWAAEFRVGKLQIRKNTRNLNNLGKLKEPLVNVPMKLDSRANAKAQSPQCVCCGGTIALTIDILYQKALVKDKKVNISVPRGII